MGGAFNLGTVFKITPGGAVTIIHSFGPAPDGANPRAALIQASDNNLYGTTENGGNRARGTLFGMTLAGASVFQYSFSGAADGAHPKAPVVQARNGALYGTVYAGDVFTRGRVFQLAGTTVRAVHTFLGGANDGSNPETGLIEGTDGFFYGTTKFGGTFDQGTAFKMTPTGTVTIVKSFTGGADGANPDTALIQPSDGNFYGATRIGGNAFGESGKGTLFKMTPAGVVTTLHTFNGTNGANPGASLVEGAGGGLYGTTVFGGQGTGHGVVFRLGTNLGSSAPGDFDGDGRSDRTVFRPSTGTWLVNYSNGATPAGFQWGNSADKLVPGDYDGDGVTDVAIFRPSNGTWYIVPSTTGSPYGIQWGNGADIAVPGDYDGDGRTDVAVFRPSTGVWFIVNSSTGSATGVQWGNSADVAVPADYDGDGRTDVAVFRPSNGQWLIVNSSTGVATGVQWGNSADIAVPGDYDGDGRTDVAVFRPSTGVWFIVPSSTGSAIGVQWGNSADRPVPGDYDGDGRTDVAVFRPSNGQWLIVNSSTGSAIGVQWGNSADTPILKRPQ